SLPNGAARVDYRDRALADDKSHIGDRALVLTTHQRDFADMHEEARGDLSNRQVRSLRARADCRAECGEHHKHNRERDAMVHSSVFFHRELARLLPVPDPKGLRRSSKAHLCPRNILLRPRMGKHSILVSPASLASRRVADIATARKPRLR